MAEATLVLRFNSARFVTAMNLLAALAELWPPFVLGFLDELNTPSDLMSLTADGLAPSARLVEFLSAMGADEVPPWGELLSDGPSVSVEASGPDAA